MVSVSGTIHAQDAVRTHTEPSEAVNVGTEAPNQIVAVRVGKFVNTGNIDQTVTFNGISDAIGCTFLDASFFSHDSQEMGTTCTIPEGSDATLVVKVQTANEPVGASDQPFSFNVNDFSWV